VAAFLWVAGNRLNIFAVSKLTTKKDSKMETKTIGSKIAKARKQINISQAELAIRLFISPQAVGKWERGESMPDIITLNRLAEITGVDLNYFSENTWPAGGDTAAGGSAAVKPEKKLSWDMSDGNWVDADFSGLKNLHEKFSSSNMQRCKFVGSAMQGLLLKSNHVDSCDFSASDLSNAHLQGSHLAGNQFNDCSLKDAEFLKCHIKSCDFTGADLTGAVFKGSALQKSTLTNAVLKHSAFNGSHMDDMVFEGTLQDCAFENCGFLRVTFQNAMLVNTFFKNSKLKGIKFINCQADRMTYEFLKSGKADLSGITLV
jgi:uncharacterized protein YjbI with pentapeptide repeats/DNA-binding XRE family transcriptional regulator